MEETAAAGAQRQCAVVGLENCSVVSAGLVSEVKLAGGPVPTADEMPARQHAIIEQVHADLKNFALAHLPSNHFSANAAWLVCAVIAFNLTRAAATLTGAARLVKATTASIRRTLISVPARIASSARRLTLHLPTDWPWETAWNMLFDSVFHRNIPIIG